MVTTMITMMASMKVRRGRRLLLADVASEGDGGKKALLRVPGRFHEKECSSEQECAQKVFLSIRGLASCGKQTGRARSLCDNDVNVRAPDSLLPPLIVPTNTRTRLETPPQPKQSTKQSPVGLR